MWWLTLFIVGSLIIILRYCFFSYQQQKEDIIDEVDKLLSEYLPDDDTIGERLLLICKDTQFLSKMDNIMEKLGNYELKEIFKNSVLVIFLIVYCYALMEVADDEKVLE